MAWGAAEGAVAALGRALRKARTPVCALKPGARKCPVPHPRGAAVCVGAVPDPPCLIISCMHADMRGDIQEIFKMTPHEKQVLMFSATLNSDMRAVCKKFMTNVRTHTRRRGHPLTRPLAAVLSASVQLCACSMRSSQCAIRGSPQRSAGRRRSPYTHWACRQHRGKRSDAAAKAMHSTPAERAHAAPQRLRPLHPARAPSIKYSIKPAGFGVCHWRLWPSWLVQVLWPWLLAGRPLIRLGCCMATRVCGPGLVRGTTACHVVPAACVLALRMFIADNCKGPMLPRCLVDI